MKIAICIPSYGHRYKGLFENFSLMKLSSDDELKKIIFLSDNDTTINEYDKYKSDDVDVVIVTANNLGDKRQKVLEYCINNGYDRMFMIDDDVKYSAKKITPETKRTTSDSYRSIKCDFNELLDVSLNIMDKNDAGHVSFVLPFYIGFKKPKQIDVNKSLNAGQFILLDLNKIKEKNISYDSTLFGTEDISLVLDCLIAGIKCVCINYMSYELCNDNFFRDNKNDTSAAFENMWDRYITMFGDNYKYNIPISIDKRKVLHRRIKFEKYVSAETMPEFKNATDKTIHNMIVDYYDSNKKFDYVIIGKVIDYLWAIYEQKHKPKN